MEKQDINKLSPEALSALFPPPPPIPSPPAVFSVPSCSSRCSEFPGDAFDRQRAIEAFPQQTIEQQSVLVLGVGGLGCSVAFSLCRIGVSRLFLLDRDFVDASNINRQILFNKDSVGKSKAAEAHKRLEDQCFRTRVYSYHVDCVSSFSLVCSLACQCTVLFNCCDYGAAFDYAIAALAKRMGIVYVSGSTYANNMEINLFPGSPSSPCFACHNSVADSFAHSGPAVEKYMKEKQQQTMDANMIMAYLCEVSCISGPHAELLVSSCLEALGGGRVDASEFASRFMKLYQTKCLESLAPSLILSYSSLTFIPKDRSFPTRLVGSWIGVCTGGALMMVNAWIKHMEKTDKINNSNDSKQTEPVVPVHNWSQFNLSLTNGGFEVVGFPNEQNRERCAICRDVNKLDKQ